MALLKTSPQLSPLGALGWFLVGTFFGLGAAVAAWFDFKTPPLHLSHLILFAIVFLASGGCVLIAVGQGERALTFLKSLLGIAAPYIPGTAARAARVSGTTEQPTKPPAAP